MKYFPECTVRAFIDLQLSSCPGSGGRLYCWSVMDEMGALHSAVCAANWGGGVTTCTFITAVDVNRCFPEALWTTMCRPGVVFCCAEGEDKNRQIRITTNERMMTRHVRSAAALQRRLISFESTAVCLRKACFMFGLRSTTHKLFHSHQPKTISTLTRYLV